MDNSRKIKSVMWGIVDGKGRRGRPNREWIDDITLMYSTGCPSSSGSYSVLLPWSGGVSWVLFHPTSEIFAVPPRAPEVAVHSAHWNRGYSLFHLLVPPQPRPVHSRWLAPLCGMGFLCRKDCSPGFFLTHFTLASKLFSLAVQGLG